GNEGKIRRKLIENGYIDTIIGLPAGIFFRTGIATIIMVLRKNRKNRDIQFIDGSKLFTKYSSTNRMEVSHIRKIVDAYIEKKDIAKFSKIASFEEIKENDFNLNISRYIDSFEKDDFHDLYASLHGGIPNTELDNFSDFWASMPNIKEILLKPLDAKYSEFKDKENIYQTILDHPDTQAYLEKYSNVVKKLKEFLRQKLGNFNDIKNIRIENLADEFDNFFFDNISQIKMLDKYELYQEAITTFKDIKTDLYNILANIDNQDNHLYFDVFANNLTIEKVYFANELEDIETLKADIEEKESQIKEIAPDNDNEENLDDEQSFEVKKIKNKIKTLKASHKKLVQDFNAKKQSKIDSIDTDEFIELLHIKWSDNLSKSILEKGNDVINSQIAKLEKLAKKYDQTLAQIDEEI
ncbi:SAM-dependent methyltransferase, partial [Mycoplasma sp. HS2188]|uniref:SAM-dependent methyltransferase n=1 Tax=Mycoplasma sp. HS2188 TaxID=2976765 RepID=UPI0021A9EA6C